MIQLTKASIQCVCPRTIDGMRCGQAITATATRDTHGSWRRRWLVWSRHGLGEGGFTEHHHQPNHEYEYEQEEAV